MKTFNVFEPEIEVAHKVFFEVPQVITITAAEATAAKGKIKAGRLVMSKGTNPIERNPEAGCKFAEDDKAQGVLAHDIVIDGAGDYPCGVILRGIVYEDVLKLANGQDLGDKDRVELKARGITVYNQKTL